MDHDKHPAAAQFDPGRRYVRIKGFRGDSFVEFEFAIGDPDMFVEMILPQAALAGFCADNNVTMLEPAAGSPADPAGEHWSLRDATQQRFRSVPGDSDTN